MASVHKPFIVDAHLDLAMNALEYNRDLLLPVEEIRRLEKEALDRGWRGHGGGECTVSLPAMRRAGIVLCVGTVYARIGEIRANLTGWASQANARAIALGHLGYYQTLARQGHLRFIGTRQDLEAHLQQVTGQEPAPLGVVLLMECADPLLTPREVEEWWQQGVRAVGPAHYGPNVYAHGTGSGGGLTPPGRELLGYMEQLGMVLDTSHLSERAFWEAVDAYAGPVMASHSNCRVLAPGDRQLSDEQLKAIIQRDGVVGIVLEISMLGGGRLQGQAPTPPVDLQRVADHIDHICQLAGNARHVGLGTDLDGGFGRERVPRGIDSITDLPRLGEVLARRGYGTEDIQAVMGGNWVDFWRRNLPAQTSSLAGI